MKRLIAMISTAKVVTTSDEKTALSAARRLTESAVGFRTCRAETMA